MSDFLGWLANSEGFAAHGYCLIWDPALIDLFVATDAVIALSYFSIPLVLQIIARRRPDLNSYKCLHLFSVFILFCGVTHVFGIVTLWEPIYAAAGMAKLATALISLVVAVMLWPLLPKVLATPKIEELEKANSDLRALAESLEHIVEERTRALRNAFAEVEAARQQAEETSSLKSQFMATMSHELRTPLNAIIGFTDMIRGGYAGDLSNQQKEYVEDIHSSSNLLYALIGDVLDMQRLEIADEPEQRVNLHELTAEAVTIISGMARENNVEIEIDVAKQLYLTTRRGGLLRVLVNLLTNAVKYIGDGNKAGVRFRRLPDGRVALEVWDNGIGIPPDRVDSIFEPFVRLHGDTSGPSGTGIGLALVRQVIEKLGGKIEVETEPGKGSCFRIDLPDHTIGLIDGAAD
ncbi:MAG: HAMP domain-containing sensor histidine kinase [Rhodospirillales bacterium]